MADVHHVGALPALGRLVRSLYEFRLGEEDGTVYF